MSCQPPLVHTIVKNEKMGTNSVPDDIENLTSDMGRDLGDDVAHLKELVKEDSGACTIDYFQLIAMLQ